MEEGNAAVSNDGIISTSCKYNKYIFFKIIDYLVFNKI
jgi:hypothetical protein